jgi:serine protease inhibitor
MFTKHLSLAGGALLFGALASAAFAENTASPPASAKLFSAPSLSGAAMDPARLLTAQAALGYRLINNLSEEKGAKPNLVTSPAGLVATFSLLDLGASPPMRAAVYDALGFGKPPADPSTDFDSLRGTMTSLVKSESGPLSFANAVFFDPATQPYRAAIAGIVATGANVAIKDLSKPESVKEVNDWVAAETKGLIPTILDEPPGKAGLVALNGLYFKDRWQTPFDKKATATAKFQTGGSRTVDVDMMHSSADQLLFRQDDHFIAVDLPYATAGFSLVIVTTKAGPAPAKAFVGAAEWLTGTSFASGKGELSLPRFSLEGGADVLGALDTPAFKTARKSPTGFSGLSPVPQVIAMVLQRTVIKVDEEGTEAAAATAVTTERSFATDFIKMTVDKPFLFGLRDQKSGLLLLAGYVGDPTGGTAAEAKAQ